MKIKRPTLIINKKRVLRNIERMANKAKKDNVRFRPHFKTHQSGEIGSWFRDSDVTAITVSSVEMALYFREQGWEDITIAFPVNKLEIEEINSLCRGSDLGLLVEAQETVSFLTKELKHKAKLWLKIDTGYHRTGIAWDAAGAAADLIKAIEKTPLLDFAGLSIMVDQPFAVQLLEQPVNFTGLHIWPVKQVQGDPVGFGLLAN